MSDLENKRSDAPQRDASGRLLPGHTANPGGRPKVQRELQAILEECGPKAAEKVKALIDSPDEKVALAAARDVLDRILGRAPQAIEVGGEALNDVLARILAGRGGA